MTPSSAGMYEKELFRLEKDLPVEFCIFHLQANEVKLLIYGDNKLREAAILTSSRSGPEKEYTEQVKAGGNATLRHGVGSNKIDKQYEKYLKQLLEGCKELGKEFAALFQQADYCLVYHSHYYNAHISELLKRLEAQFKGTDLYTFHKTYPSTKEIKKHLEHFIDEKNLKNSLIDKRISAAQ